ncbi:hypothetical protein JXC34_03985 [Candidatus Woesearchaeota archaeon]|nr:hypothetical protein [Candidatus Woesearchaeota archaeon]
MMIDPTFFVTSNATATNSTGVSANLLNYVFSLPVEVSQGNTVAIIIALLAFFVAIIVINAVSSLLISFLKRTILLIIILLVLIGAFPTYIAIIQAEGFTFSNIIMGVLALVASVFAVFIASRSFAKSAKEQLLKLADKIRGVEKTPEDKIQEQFILKKELELKKEIQAEEAALHHQQESLKGTFSKEALQNEKSVFAVLVYLIVAEFGVFSSPTLSAPSVQVGILFFTIFIVGILLFAKHAYKNFKTAATYFGVTFVVGITLSFVLGLLWGKNTLAELLSPAFFTSDSLVAMITGMGVSLFAGSKG